MCEKCSNQCECCPCKSRYCTSTTSANVRGDILVLTVEDIPCLINGTTLYIRLSQEVEGIDLEDVPNVVINAVGYGTYTVIQSITCELNGVPNNLYADQLYRYCNEKTTLVKGQYLLVKFATDTECFSYFGERNPLPMSNEKMPKIKKKKPKSEPS